MCLLRHLSVNLNPRNLGTCNATDIIHGSVVTQKLKLYPPLVFKFGVTPLSRILLIKPRRPNPSPPKKLQPSLQLCKLKDIYLKQNIFPDE